jgi:hypothetical protein
MESETHAGIPPLSNPPFAFALASEIGPDFSPDINEQLKDGALAPGTRLPHPKTLSTPQNPQKPRNPNKPNTKLTKNTCP